MDYIKPKSLTFWAGTFAIVIGIVMIAWRNQPPELSTVASLLAALTGSTQSDPVSLIVIGLGLIGVRRAIGER